MDCGKCGAANPEGKKFCGDCGAAVVQGDAPVAAAAASVAHYCFRHKKEETRVTCGRCERPICPRCMVHGPAGVRCGDCARNRVPIRPRGVLHSAGQQLEQNGPRTVWYLAMWAMIVSFFSGMFGGGSGDT